MPYELTPQLQRLQSLPQDLGCAMCTGHYILCSQHGQPQIAQAAEQICGLWFPLFLPPLGWLFQRERNANTKLALAEAREMGATQHALHALTRGRLKKWRSGHLGAGHSPIAINDDIHLSQS